MQGMTRIQARGPERFLHPGETALLVSFEAFTMAVATQSLESMAEQVALGGADALVVTPAQAAALGGLGWRIALIVVAQTAADVQAAQNIGADAVLLARAGPLQMAAAREAGLAILLSGRSRRPGILGVILPPVKLPKRRRAATEESPVNLVRLDALLSPPELLARARALADAGARGLVFGRSVWTFHDPAAIARALAAVLHQAQSPAEAGRALTADEDRGGSAACLTGQI